MNFFMLIIDLNVWKQFIIGLIPGNKNGFCLVTNITILGFGNVTKKETEKNVKYKVYVLQNILNVKRRVVTSNNEASGTVPLSLRKYSHNILGNQLCRLWRKLGSARDFVGDPGRFKICLPERLKIFAYLKINII